MPTILVEKCGQQSSIDDELKLNKLNQDLTETRLWLRDYGKIIDVDTHDINWSIVLYIHCHKYDIAKISSNRVILFPALI